MSCLYGKKLSASTLLETVTASVIFMIIFVMAMDTLTRLLTFDIGDSDYIVIENDLRKCRKQISKSELRPEKRTFHYDWGELNVEITAYKENIYQIDMKCRHINYRFLQANNE
jgi:hypothetical protein